MGQANMIYHSSQLVVAAILLVSAPQAASAWPNADCKGCGGGRASAAVDMDRVSSERCTKRKNGVCLEPGQIRMQSKLGMRPSKSCIKRAGICTASPRDSDSSRKYRESYVDAQRRDRTIVRTATDIRNTRERDDLRGEAMSDAYGEPSPSVGRLVGAAAKVLNVRTSSHDRYEARQDRADLKQAEDEHDNKHPH